MRNKTIYLMLFLLPWVTQSAWARLYSYVNSEGDYVITRTKPKNVDEYSILTNDGEFIRLVTARDRNVPISHWRPWFLPKEPHPFDAKPQPKDRVPTVVVDEVERTEADDE